MSETVRRQVRLTFPQHLVGQPILFRMASDHDLVPSVRRAHLDGDGAEVLLELEGRSENLERGLEYLRSQGVSVSAAEGEVGA